MPTNRNDLDEKELLQWIRQSVATESNVFSKGYQGRVYLFNGKDGRKLIIKAATGKWPGKLIRRMMLHNECRVYARLPPIEGIPHCFGIIDRSYLVLEFIDGMTLRKADIEDRTFFFEAFLKLIQQLHMAGVAHADLKRKDNILVVGGRKPYIVDFGAAVIKKEGFAPLNRYLYHTAKKFDLNAWVKLKYNRKFEDMSAEDSRYYNRTLIEKAAHHIKDAYLMVKKAIIAALKTFKRLRS